MRLQTERLSTDMKKKSLFLSLIPGTGIFCLIFIAAVQSNAPRTSAIALAVALASLTSLVALVGLVSVRSLKVAEMINRNMATKKLVEKLHRQELRINRRDLAHVFHQIEATIQLESIFGFENPLPPSRSWAASPDLILNLAIEVKKFSPNLVVELGSGLSTLWTARMLRESNNGKIVSIESDPVFAELTKQNIVDHGLSDWAEVRLAPLTEEIEITGEVVPWYELNMISDLKEIDVLIVDGPPGSNHEKSRWPAYQVFRDRMSERASIFIDDCIRESELELALTWENESNFVANQVIAEKGLMILRR